MCQWGLPCCPSLPTLQASDAASADQASCPRGQAATSKVVRAEASPGCAAEPAGRERAGHLGEVVLLQVLCVLAGRGRGHPRWRPVGTAAGQSRVGACGHGSWAEEAEPQEGIPRGGPGPEPHPAWPSTASKAPGGRNGIPSSAPGLGRWGRGSTCPQTESQTGGGALASAEPHSLHLQSGIGIWTLGWGQG